MIYEVMYIIPSKYSDSEVEGMTAKVNGLFEKHGATIERQENFGKIKLAFPVKKERYGTYVLVFINAEGDQVAKIDQDLRLADEVLRHVIVKREKGIPANVTVPETYVPPLTPEGKRALAKAKHEEKPRPKAPASEKLSTAELDKKLDEILESDITNDV